MCGRTTVAAFLALVLGLKAASLNQQLQEWLLPADKKAGAKRGVKRRTLFASQYEGALEEKGLLFSYWHTSAQNNRFT